MEEQHFDVAALDATKEEQSTLAVKCEMLLHSNEKADSRLATNSKLKEGGVEFISMWNEGFDDFPL